MIPGAIDAGDGIPFDQAPLALSASERYGYDEFGLDYVPGSSVSETSFSADDFPG